MATAIQPEAPIQSLRDPRLKEKLQELRRTDNYTNIYYFLRTYVFLALVIGGTIWFYHYRSEAGLSVLWNIPVTFAAILCVGAAQHQLTGLAHEASHHILFKNRLFNDLASDWLCMYPMFSTTHHYRLQHLAHHQFVNDPERDPDVSQLQTSGHWLHFPVSKAVFLWTLVKQLWVPNLIKFIRIRAKYNSFATDKSPYLKKGSMPSKFAIRVGLVYMLALVGVLAASVWARNVWALAIAPAAMWAAVMAFYAAIPARMYSSSRIHPVLPMRAVSLMRITFVTLLFCGLAWLSLLVDPWAPAYFLLLWVVPIFTSFSFYMILRQLVQHGNGDRGWLTNTRVFFVNKLINFAVFPMGQDFHLPHHLFASIPHYRLRKLHAELLKCEEYRREAVIVEGYFFPHHRPPTHPTVLDVVGPQYYHKAEEVYIDNEVLEGDQVEDKEAIIAQGEEEKRRRREELERERLQAQP